jgi:hypothetical protein
VTLMATYGRSSATGLYKRSMHALHTARGQLAEHDALLGQGHLAALDKPEGARRLREVQELFALIGYAPAFARAEAGLAQTGATPAR